ncbi:MAG: phosphonate ABC transporter ATP-binding protein [Betaproteobacteria bacterium]
MSAPASRAALDDPGGVLSPRARIEASGAAQLPLSVVLGARAVSRRYGHGTAQRGVFDISLTLRAGEFVALLGASGAGKTTLLRLLAGLEVPDAGRIERTGHSATRHHRGDTSVAIVFQRPRLIGRLTAIDNVLGGRLGHVPRWRGLARRFREEDWRAALTALARVGLLERAEERTDRLSGGEQQRVAIARALAQQPRALLADEPVASLDPANAVRVLDILRALADDGLAVLCSLHQPEWARQYADRVLGLAAGRLSGPLAPAALDERALAALYVAPTPPV